MSSKYHNQRTMSHGVLFASKREATRYSELLSLHLAGEITGLTLQPSYPLRVNGLLICRYRGDFLYHDTKIGRDVLEDVKGVQTPVYKLKKKLVKAIYGLDIIEV